MWRQSTEATPALDVNRLPIPWLNFRAGQPQDRPGLRHDLAADPLLADQGPYAAGRVGVLLGDTLRRRRSHLDSQRTVPGARPLRTQWSVIFEKGPAGPTHSLGRCKSGAPDGEEKRQRDRERVAQMKKRLWNDLERYISRIVMRGVLFGAVDKIVCRLADDATETKWENGMYMASTGVFQALPRWTRAEYFQSQSRPIAMLLSHSCCFSGFNWRPAKGQCPLATYPCIPQKR
ncbi:hypothetical protein B0H14DRAFT_3148426 [Mycena olivaceomarginata]|nr:hypothetical protein B0H14DRAFT_3148426 [Mycena olivaceomarginata]